MEHELVHGITADGWGHYIWHCSICLRTGRTFGKWGAHWAWFKHWLYGLAAH